MNRIVQLAQSHKSKLLSVYLTAGYPSLEALPEIILALQESGADLIEIGIPFSDPIADGPVIQYTSTEALKNGATPAKILNILKDIKNEITIPFYIMSYYNPLYYGNIHTMLEQIKEAGADGIIIPDLPLNEYEEKLHPLCVELELENMFLYSARTPRERVDKMRSLSKGFLYLLAGSIITGQTINGIQVPDYYHELQLKEKTLVGFGIKNHERFREAGAISRGAIVGTAFLEWIGQYGTQKKTIADFIYRIRENEDDN